MNALRADIVGDDYVCGSIRAGMLFTLCEKVIEAGHDPAARLEVFRGTMLCLTVRTLGEGARLEALGAGFRRRRPGKGPAGAADEVGGNPAAVRSKDAPAGAGQAHGPIVRGAGA
jgi:hypothetical protein